MVNSGLLPKHSPLGASGVSRFIACLGSVPQSVGCEDNESEFAKEGTAAHVVGENCLTHKQDAWTAIGASYLPMEEVLLTKDEEAIEHLGPGVPVTKDMADAVQTYLDAIQAWHPDRHQGNSWIERKFHCPDIHELFYGTSDFVYLDEDVVDEETEEISTVLHVWDYKHGAGIVVEATRNPQCMYYAAGAIEDLNMWNEIDKVVIHIMQPRGWHWQGPHRTWEVSTDDLDAWLFDELVPAMEKAEALRYASKEEVLRNTVVGEHCRFCPARSYQCPALLKAMDELQELIVMVTENMTAKTKKDQEAEAVEGAKELTSEQLGQIKNLEALGKIVFKAVNTVAFGRLSNGAEVPHCKLVNSRTNREYKKGAEKAAKRKFGAKCMTKPELVSPATLDGLPEGKAFTTRWAFKPEGGTTVAVEGDPRRCINRDAKSLFTKD